MDKKHLKNKKTCNCCGYRINAEQEMEFSMVSLEISWGYFSNKDGEIHKITLCENCYDNWTETFKIPVEIQENRELL